MASATTVGILRVLLSANSAAFETAMAKSSASTRKFSGDAAKAQAATGLFSGSITKLIGALSAERLISKAASVLVNFGRSAVDSAGNLVDLSSKTGLSIDAIQRMSYVAKQTSTDVNAFTTAAFNLGVRLAGGSGSVKSAVNDLGLSYSNLRTLKPEAQFDAIARALGAMEDPQKRNEIAVALFGRTAKDILPAIEQGYARIAAEARVSSAEQVKAVDAAADAWGGFVENAKSSTVSFLGNMVLANQQAHTLDWVFSPIVDVSGVQADFAKISGWWQLLRGDLGQPVTVGSPFAAIISGNAAGLVKDLPADLDAIEKALDKETAAQKKAADAADAHAVSLAKIRDELSGKGLLANAADYVRIVQELGGVSGLTRDQQDKLNTLLADAIAKYAALGKDAPKALLDIYAATMPLIPATQGWGNELLKSFRNIGLEEPAATAGIANLYTGIGTLTTLATESGIQAGLLSGAYRDFGLKTRAELQAVADAAKIHYAALLEEGTATPQQMQAAYEKMTDAVNAATGKIPSFWESTVGPQLKAAFQGIGAEFSDVLARMITAQTGWKDGFLGIWHSIKDAVNNIFSQILNAFINRFLKGMLGAISGQQGSFSSAFSGMFSGGSGSSGLGSSLMGLFGGGGGATGGIGIGGATGGAGMLTSRPISGMMSMPGGGGAAGGMSAGMSALGGVGGGVVGWQIGSALTERYGKAKGALGGMASGAAMGAMMGGPIGAAVGGVIGLVGGLIAKSAESKFVNKPRDEYLQSFETGGARAKEGTGTTPTGAGSSLAGQLTVAGAGAGGGKLMQAIFDAKDPKAFESAVKNAEAALAKFQGTQDKAAASTQLAADAAGRYGLSIEDMGDAFQQAAIGKLGDALLADMTALEKAGVDQETILTSMAGSFQELYDTAQLTGEAIPPALQPTIDKLLEMGLVLDADGMKAKAAADAIAASFAVARDKALESIKALEDEQVSLMQSISNEALEEQMGVIETQTRDRIALLAQEAAKQQAALDESTAVAAAAIKAATDDATAGVDETAGSVDQLGDRVDTNTDTWRSWRDTVLPYIQDVEDAVNGVTVGHSFGGLKEYAPMLEGAGRAFAQMATIGSRSLEGLSRAATSLADGLMAALGFVPGPGDMAEFAREGKTTVDAALAYMKKQREGRGDYSPIDVRDLPHGMDADRLRSPLDPSGSSGTAGGGDTYEINITVGEGAPTDPRKAKEMGYVMADTFIGLIDRDEGGRRGKLRRGLHLQPQS